MQVYDYFLSYKTQSRKGVIVLLDPDKGGKDEMNKRAGAAEQAGAAAVFVGGSHIGDNDFDDTLQAMKQELHIPLIIFPGGSSQVSQYADAILFLSLISGRNPQYLIGEHITAAPKVKKLRLEVISTAYMLVESGKISAVEYISNTKPIPREQVKIAAAHAMAAEMLGMKLVYLEAGSGALYPVPPEMISAVRKAVDLPLLVGGGIKDAGQAQSAFTAGADFVVIGNALESGDDWAWVKGIKTDFENPSLIHPLRKGGS